MRAITIIFLGILAFATASNDKKIVCYLGSWATYRPGDGKFVSSDINATLCTHLIYAFVGISDQGEVKILDSALDLGENGFAGFNKLRDSNPELKTLVAIGGWNEGSTNYSKVVGDPELRKNFTENVVTFVKKHGFNGFDVDWEYPNQRGGVVADKENFVKLLEEMRKRFDEETLILSVAVAASEASASQSYIIPDVSKHVHFINLMAYDYHVPSDNKTGFNAPLLAGSGESEVDKKLNINASVAYWLSQGAPPEKLNLGVPFYGRSFTLDDETNITVGAPASKPGDPGPYTRAAGTLGYNELCEKFMAEKWNITFQDEQVASYAVRGNQWVSYDDSSSITRKANWVNELGLGGVMVWSVETDDFKGKCGQKYPLLMAINTALRRIPAQPPQS